MIMSRALIIILLVATAVSMISLIGFLKADSTDVISKIDLDKSYQIIRNNDGTLFKSLQLTEKTSEEEWMFRWKYKGSIVTTVIPKSKMMVVIDDRIDQPEFTLVFRNSSSLRSDAVVAESLKKDFNPNGLMFYVSSVKVKMDQKDYDKLMK